MQEKNPNPARQQDPAQQPDRRPSDNPEPRKDFPGKAPDVYSDKGQKGSKEMPQNPNPGHGKGGNPGQGGGAGERSGGGQTPGGSRGQGN